MTRIALGIVILAGVAAAPVLGHLALIEVVREAVTLRTQRPDGRWRETRLWIVDDGASSWLQRAAAASG